MRVQPHQLRVKRHHLMRLTRTPDRHAKRLFGHVPALHRLDPVIHRIEARRYTGPCIAYRLSQRHPCVGIRRHTARITGPRGLRDALGIREPHSKPEGHPQNPGVVAHAATPDGRLPARICASTDAASIRTARLLT